MYKVVSIKVRPRLLCILREKLTFKYNPADMQTKCSQFHNSCVHQKKEWCVNLKPITGGCILSLNKIQTKFNELSSSSTWHFLFHFPSFTTIIHPPTFLAFPLYCLPSLRLPSSVFHSKSTSLPPSFSLAIQNNSYSRKRAINLLQWDQSARECQGYSRLLSLLTPTQHWVT